MSESNRIPGNHLDYNAMSAEDKDRAWEEEIAARNASQEPQPGEDTDEGEGQDEAPTQEQRPAQPQEEPPHWQKAAYKEEREKRQAAEKEARELRQMLAQYQTRQPAQPVQQPQEEEEPDRDLDPAGYADWRIQQNEKRIEERLRKIEEAANRGAQTYQEIEDDRRWNAAYELGKSMYPDWEAAFDAGMKAYEEDNPKALQDGSASFEAVYRHGKRLLSVATPPSAAPPRPSGMTKRAPAKHPPTTDGMPRGSGNHETGMTAAQISALPQREYERAMKDPAVRRVVLGSSS